VYFLMFIILSLKRPYLSFLLVKSFLVLGFDYLCIDRFFFLILQFL
jgi:hypothetical protein